MQLFSYVGDVGITYDEKKKGETHSQTMSL